MVVMQLERLGVHRLVEGPGVGGMFLREHLLQDGVAVFHLLAQLAAFPPPSSTSAGSHVTSCHLLARLPAGLGRAGCGLAAGRAQFGRFGVLSGRRVCTTGGDGRRGRSGGVGFPLHTFLLLGQTGRQVKRETGRQLKTDRKVYFGSCDALPDHTSVTLTTGSADGIMVAGGCGAETGGVVWTGVGVVEMTGV